MKKWRSICVVLLSMALLFGCSEKQPKKTEDEKGAVQQEDNEDTETEATVENETPEIIEGVTEEGFLTAESLESESASQVRVVRRLRKNEGYIGFVEVTIGEKVLHKEVGIGAPTGKGDHLYLVDMDGDAVQEIIIHYDTGGCGGCGSFVSMVLKLENDEIHTLFETHSEFDTGFSSSFADGYQMHVTNAHTGYSLTFEAKEHHKKVFFDEKGTVTSQDSFFIDCFYEFAPQDADEDGIYEIAGKQYTYLQGHPDGVGDACSVLKYNIDTQTFEVVDAWFEPYTEQ